VAPKKVRMATWIIDFSYTPKNGHDWCKMVLRSLPAIFGMGLVVSGLNSPVIWNGWLIFVAVLGR
jgi:hypothetical protein